MVIMSCSRGFFVTGAGFVIRRIPAGLWSVLRLLPIVVHGALVSFWLIILPAKNAIALGSSVRCHDSFWFISVGHDFMAITRSSPFLTLRAA
jgi:hypothetical protein